MKSLIKRIQHSRVSAHLTELCFAKAIKLRGVYLGWDTLEGESFRMGTFGRLVFCVRQNTACREKTKFFRQAQSASFDCGTLPQTMSRLPLRQRMASRNCFSTSDETSVT